MKNFLKKSVRRVGVNAMLIASVFVVGESCTNLTEVPHDALTPNNAFKTPTEILAGVAGVYAQLRSTEWVGYDILEELTTDAEIVPTRGNDWYDNGQWLDLHRQTWTANSAGTLAFVDGAWNDLFSGVAKANLMIDVVTKAAPANKDSSLAELRTLRAWYYYMLQDMFGGVPLVETTELKQYPRSTRKEIFDFIEKELTQSIPNLPVKWDPSNYGRVTKGAAYAMLAELYLNAGVFTKESAAGGINATSYNTCKGVTVAGGTGTIPAGDACNAAIAATDSIFNLGQYSLAANWYDNFSLTNKSSPENIFVIVHSSLQGLGGNWPMRTLHYNQLNTGDGSPWNGFATLATTYAQWSPTDDRRNMWLEGQAYSFQNGQAAKDRNGNSLVFTDSIADANAASEGEGVRFNKFPPLPSAPTGSGHPNDFTIFRLSEMYLIRAEAENEAGNQASAIVDLAKIHNKHDPTNPIAAGLTQQQLRDAILKERLLELTAEGKRRTDLIRNGHFLDQWIADCPPKPASCAPNQMRNGKVAKTSEPFRVLFPISALQLQSNPLLQQNPGY